VVVSDLRGTALAGLAAVVLACSVGVLQPRLATKLHAIKETSDVYPFPPPPLLRLATLGYVAATTDVLWGKLLVEHGTHWGEHRPFLDLENYLDAIVALDPTFRPFYEYVDSLLCYRPMNGHEADARKTRVYLENGTKVLPNDAEIWRKYGQFLAFMGPSYLSDENERRQWKHDGAMALTHAVDLGADVDLGIAASAVLDSRLGEKKAAIEFLERAYALTDDEATRQEIAARLAIAHADEATDCAREMFDTIAARWREGYPFLDRGTFMLIGPSTNAMRCVGPGTSTDPACARDWDAVVPAGSCR
jgi:tetratricopeptide (TPR) repeat protein